MKLLRFGPPLAERPAVELDGTIYEVTPFHQDFDEAFFEADGPAQLEHWVRQHHHQLPVIDLASVRLGPPLRRPSKIICVGHNYADHAIEQGAKLPKEPVLFQKATSSWNGPNDPVILPPGSGHLDYEVELALVIGRRACRVAVDQALEHVAGATILIDYSERSWQKDHGGQWTKGKSADTFCPCGPWVVPLAELPAPADLGLCLSVNGERRQEARASSMIFDAAFLVSYVSLFMTLLPGDIIATGTPGGVGMALDPPRYLQVGDEVEATIDGIGTIRQRIALG